MTEEEALRQMRWLAHARVLEEHVGADRLIQAGLDALLAGVDTPSLPLLAGLGRREEPEAGELFTQVVQELGWHIQAPTNPVAAARSRIYWLAEQVVGGSLDLVTGVDRMWLEMLTELDMSWPYPEELRPIAVCASDLEDWNESWSLSLEELKTQAMEAVHQLLRSRPAGEEAM